jgi:hypothetical protein
LSSLQSQIDPSLLYTTCSLDGSRVGVGSGVEVGETVSVGVLVTVGCKAMAVNVPGTADFNQALLSAVGDWERLQAARSNAATRISARMGHPDFTFSSLRFSSRAGALVHTSTGLTNQIPSKFPDGIIWVG